VALATPPALPFALAALAATVVDGAGVFGEGALGVALDAEAVGAVEPDALGEDALGEGAGAGAADAADGALAAGAGGSACGSPSFFEQAPRKSAGTNARSEITTSRKVVLIGAEAYTRRFASRRTSMLGSRSSCNAPSSKSSPPSATA